MNSKTDSNESFDVLVIGGGPAGVTAALRAAELGARVALVERDRMGGTCTNDGCVPTRVLAKAARLFRDATQFGDYGLNAPLPEVDFPRLLSRTQQVVYRVHEKKQLAGHLRQAGVVVYESAGEASFIDAHSLALPSGERLRAEKFIICAGGHARRFPFPGGELAITHHDVWSMKKLPHSVAIVGGAATGSQLASIFAAFGVQVTLLETQPYLLGREDSMIAEILQNAFVERDIRAITGIGGVDHIERVSDGLELFYKHQDEVRSVIAEAAILSVGWVGNLEKLNLAAAGVESARGYVVVDDSLRTSAPHIFAAGDVTGRMMLVQSGSYDGRIAAENAILGVGQVYAHQVVPHGGFTDPEYGSVGLTEAQARQSEPGCVVSIVRYADLDRAVIDGRTEGACKLIVSAENHRILGAHIIGEQALEIIELAAVAMASDTWIETLAELELAYPTFTAILGLAARQAVRTLGVMPVAPHWRSLSKPLAEWERSN